MNKSEEVEYCNLELRFDRRHIQDLIKELIQEGYSLYWSENETQFVISIRTGRKLVKLRFQRTGSGFKLVGDYMIRDPKLAEWMEKLIENTRGHAVVKRFKDRQILIENILFGEVIRLVEISGYRQRVLFQKGTPMTEQEMVRLFESDEGEQRLLLSRLETDDELEKLHAALQEGNQDKIAACKQRLRELSLELMRLEW
ncbi:hypothetical protein MHI43_09585 [Paenibacillus sp. FSL H8-0457]|uniref:hypothetical protein n=1 Tax=Bacillales TaxID=1385 RepID=UPI00017899DE|nr:MULTISPECIES: hypothetical protein [Paenibacillus]ACX64186.1 conserved hypothetical protein [Paenibacillus sp. Y412MC10]ETT57236.1 hypothetical protein C172_30083 [Paenibacillus sp. FSL H8-457]MCM3256511.1 hypothetical protein [Paenibacillus lautus]PCL94439.1 hypothetical protein CPZ30_01770 [Paenibacillus lautus]QOT07671.1 hypothetical protein JNUCC32_15835 [Paenibacillus sp. JNUCC-32]